MSSSESSESSSPPPMRDLSRRGIYIEPLFDPTSFKGKPFCDEAINVIASSHLMALTRLPEHYYPRIVRQFYEHFKLEDEAVSGLKTCSVKIEGKEYRFDSNDIAKALGMKGYKPIAYDDNEIGAMISLMYRPPTSNPKNELRESFLHENFWVIGKFMRAYACPYTHEHIIPQYLYKYWNGMYRDKIIDVPALMVESMVNARDGGRTTKNPHGLVLPRAITAILKRLKFKFLSTEPKASSDGRFDYNKVKGSLDALARGHNLGEASKSKRHLARERKAAKQSEQRQEERVHEQPHEPMDTGGGGHYSHVGDQHTNVPPHPNFPNAQHFEGTSSYQQPFMPSQEQWETQMSNQTQMFTMMQDMHLRNQGYGTMWEGMQTQMQGYGEVLQGMQGTMQGMQDTLQSLDSRVQGLETRWGTAQTYQRKQRRKQTINIEEEHEDMDS